MEPPVGVHLGVGAEGLHHGLVAGGGVVDVVDDIVAVGQHLVHVPVRAHLAGAQVALVVGSHRAERAPVVLGVHQNRAVQGLMGIQHRLQHLVLHFDELQGLVGSRLVLSGHNGHGVPHKADPLIQNQPVVGRGLGVGLPRHGKALLGHILIGVHRHHPGHLLGHVGVDLLNQGVGVGASQHLHHQAVFGGHVVHIGGLAQQQGHGVLFPHRLPYGFQVFHVSPSPSCGLNRPGCPAAVPRTLSSGTGFPPKRRGSHRPWGRGSPAAGPRCS